MKVKTIDIIALEWFDKNGGNSYFSASISINFGTKSQKDYSLPFQYGYGEHYIDMANQYLIENGIIKGERYDNGGYPALWRYCKDNKIILRTTKHENRKKRELKKS